MREEDSWKGGREVGGGGGGRVGKMEGWEGGRGVRRRAVTARQRQLIQTLN